jgi:hypothetical protein
MNLRIALLALSSFLGVLLASGAVVTNCNEADLRAAIVQGGTVTFLCSGTISISGPTILITNDLTLDGTGASVTLDGGAGRRLFDVAPGARFELRELSLINGFAVGANSGGYPAPGDLAEGGAIRLSNAILVANSCLFSNNACWGGTGARAPGGGSFVSASTGGNGNGGAVHAVGSSLFLTNCTFVKNYTLGGDGGLGTFGGISSHVLGGGSLGGAIGLAGSSGFIFDCNFISNSLQSSISPSFQYGGALYAKTSTVQLGRNQFTGNSALGGGGGALAFDSATTFSSDCSFNANLSGGGGAVYATAGTTTVQRCQFTANTGGGGGGALQTANSRSMIVSSVFSNNFGGNGGGAAFDGAIVTASNSVFMANSASGNGGGYGGGIWNSATSTVVNCTLVSNWASVGGGGIYNNNNMSATSTVANCTLVWNSCFALGGGVHTRSPLILQHCTIATNMVTNPGVGGLSGGGGLYSYHGIPVLQGVSISGVILAGNTVSGTNQNVLGPLTDAGYNLSSDATPPLAGTSSNGVNPMLAAPADNGRLGPTMALLPGSPAINAFKGPAFPPTDQRGVLRPQRLFSDIGAYELTYSLLVTRSNQTIWISYPSVPNHWYTLQSSLVPAPTWSDGEAKTSATSTVQFSVPNSNSMQFFRVRE